LPDLQLLGTVEKKVAARLQVDLTYPTEWAVYHVWEHGVEKETRREFVDQQ
jgi:hypothetical protein